MTVVSTSHDEVEGIVKTTFEAFKVCCHFAFPSRQSIDAVVRVVQGGLFHVPRAEKSTHHESRIFKFYFEALHLSSQTCASRITKNIFLKLRFSVNEMI